METEFWKHLFELVAWSTRSVWSIWRELSTTTDIHVTHKYLRELKQKLIMESPYISKIRSTLRVIDANIERFEQPHNFDLASDACLFIEYWADKLYETINNNIIQHNIKSTALTSINILGKKFKPVFNKISNDCRKFNEIFALSNIGQASYDKFYSTDHSMVESLEAVGPVIEKIYSAKNNNQIRKIFREIKSLMNEEIKRAHKIHLSYVVKVKLLLKSERKRKFPKENVILKIKTQTDNESLKQLNIYSHFLLFSFIAKLLALSLVKNRISLNLNWKYFRRKQSQFSGPKRGYCTLVHEWTSIFAHQVN